MYFRISILLLFISSSAFSQIEMSGSLGTRAFLSNKTELPFWFYSNQEDILDQNSDFLFQGDLKISYKTYSDFKIDAGVNLIYNNSFENSIIPYEFYLRFYNDLYEFSIGRISRKKYYNGISATNQNIIWSNNALPLPGFSFNSLKPVYFSKEFGFEFEWGEYILNDDRWVIKSLVHHKALRLVYGDSSNFQIKLGINHYAQWSGTSITEGKQPGSLEDYLRVVFALPGDSNATEEDQHIALGNHIGSYEFQVLKDFNDFTFTFIYNSIFEDRKGSRLGNFPDGRYGFNFSLPENYKSLVDNIHYDFIYTRSQSNQINPSIASDYFNNQTYRSGWTYNQRIIGVPFFDYSEKLNRVTGNKFLAHHIGISGSFSSYFYSYPYRLLISHVHKEGAYFNYYAPNRDELFINYEMGLLKEPFKLNILIGTEFSNVAEPIFGAGLSLSKQF